jgi:hypothetical protein
MVIRPSTPSDFRSADPQTEEWARALPASGRPRVGRELDVPVTYERELFRPDGRYTTDPAFYAFTAANPEKTRATIAWTYRQNRYVRIDPGAGPEMIQRLQGVLDARYLGLLLDPGIASHFDAFLKFAEQRRTRGELPGPATLRSEFAKSKSTGTTRLWRGTLVTAEQGRRLEQLQGAELEALVHELRLLRPGRRDGQWPSFKRMLHPLLSTESTLGLWNNVGAHIGGKSYDSAFVSFSGNIEVTHLASQPARGLSRGTSGLPKGSVRFVLMGVDLLEVDTVRLGGVFPQYPANTFQTVVGGQPFEMAMNHPDFEVLTYGDHTPMTLRELHVYQDLPSHYGINIAPRSPSPGPV